MKNRTIWARFLDLCHAKYSVVSSDVFFVWDGQLIHGDEPFIERNFYIIVLDEYTKFLPRPIFPYYFVHQFPYYEGRGLETCHDIWKLTDETRNQYGEEYYSFE